MNDQRSISGSTALLIVDHLRATFWSAPRFYPILGIATLIALVLTVLPIGGTETRFWSFNALVILLMAVVVAPALLAFGHWRLGDQQKQVTYVVDADSIVTRDATGAAINLPWSVVRGCIESRSGFVLAVRPAGVRWLAKRAFRAEDIGALRSLIKSKLGEAAKLRDEDSLFRR